MTAETKMLASGQTNDPYPNPFPWPDTFTREAPEGRLFNPLPCEMQCEQGFLPLPSGELTECWACAEISG